MLTRSAAIEEKQGSPGEVVAGGRGSAGAGASGGLPLRHDQWEGGARTRGGESAGASTTRAACDPPRRAASLLRADDRGGLEQGRPRETCQQARFFRRRRSRSLIPPQIPKRSSLARAYSRHSTWTTQVWQILLAARVEPPFSGKKQSASLPRQAARSYQGCGSTRKTVVVVIAPPSLPAIGQAVWCERNAPNCTTVITSVGFRKTLSAQRRRSHRFFPSAVT